MVGDQCDAVRRRKKKRKRGIVTVGVRGKECRFAAG
jgi:hypothetical protein